MINIIFMTRNRRCQIHYSNVIANTTSQHSNLRKDMTHILSFEKVFWGGPIIFVSGTYLSTRQKSSIYKKVNDTVIKQRKYNAMRSMQKPSN